MKYAYAAVFTPEENGLYSVRFPDLPGCHTCGDSFPDAITMAQDALCLWLFNLEEEKRGIPPASQLRDIETREQEFVSAVAVDTDNYRRLYENKSVKKTLSIPMWLNHQAEHANAPFSQILQKGLKDYLGIQEGSRP